MTKKLKIREIKFEDVMGDTWDEYFKNLKDRLESTHIFPQNVTDIYVYNGTNVKIKYVIK